DSADSKLAIHGPRTPTNLAPPHEPGAVFRGFFGLGNLRFTCHARFLLDSITTLYVTVRQHTLPLVNSRVSGRAHGRFLRAGGGRLLNLERHAEALEQLARLVVAPGASDDERHIQTLRPEELVRIQFRKHELFGEAQAVVAVAVERIGIQPAKV